jgi:hypothetical protein
MPIVTLHRHWKKVIRSCQNYRHFALTQVTKGCTVLMKFQLSLSSTLFKTSFLINKQYYCFNRLSRHLSTATSLYTTFYITKEQNKSRVTIYFLALFGKPVNSKKLWGGLPKHLLETTLFSPKKWCQNYGVWRYRTSYSLFFQYFYKPSFIQVSSQIC